VDSTRTLACKLQELTSNTHLLNTRHKTQDTELAPSHSLAMVIQKMTTMGNGKTTELTQQLQTHREPMCQASAQTRKLASRITN
jgi:hypothetical protein